MALGINNGWFDPLIQVSSSTSRRVIKVTSPQNVAYYDFAQAKYNNYFDLVNSTVLNQVQKALYGPGGCKEQEEKCYKTGKDKDCKSADDYCIENVFVPAVGNQDSYYSRTNLDSVSNDVLNLILVLHNATDPFPSESVRVSVMQAIRLVSQKLKPSVLDFPQQHGYCQADWSRIRLPGMP